MSKSTHQFFKTEFDAKFTWIDLADVDLDSYDPSCQSGDPSFGLGGVPIILRKKQEPNPGLKVFYVPFNEAGGPQASLLKSNKNPDGSDVKKRSNSRTVWVEPDSSAGNRGKIEIEKPEVEGEFNCSYCRKRLSSRFYLANHEDRYHKIFKCQECDLPLAGSRFLRSHLIKQHDYQRDSKKTATVFMCYVCKKIFKSKDKLEFHVRSLHDKTPCRFCGKLLFRRNLGRHLRMVHPSKEKVSSTMGENVVQCFSGKCNGRRMTEKYKKRHENLFHRHFNCEKCSKDFEGYRDYGKHLKMCFNENEKGDVGEALELGHEMGPFAESFNEAVGVEPVEFHTEYGLFNAEYNPLSVGLAGLGFDNLFHYSTSVEDIFGI